MFKTNKEQTTATITDGGKEYIFTLLSNPPIARLIAAKQYEVQDELRIDTDVLLSNLNLILQSLNGTQPDTVKAIQIATATKARVELAADIVKNKLALASVLWLLEGENPKMLDASVTAKKVRLMESSEEALGFFLQGLERHFQNYTVNYETDTLIALHRQQEILRMLSSNSNKNE